jgi:hypothetical protein
MHRATTSGVDLECAVCWARQPRGARAEWGNSAALPKQESVEWIGCGIEKLQHFRAAA